MALAGLVSHVCSATLLPQGTGGGQQRGQQLLKLNRPWSPRLEPHSQAALQMSMVVHVAFCLKAHLINRG